MPLQSENSVCKTVRDRRTAFYADRLAALRFQSFIARCQLARAHNDGQRVLLERRLDLTDARSADLTARLLSIGAP
jgi:hypothetical protein